MKRIILYMILFVLFYIFIIYYFDQDTTEPKWGFSKLEKYRDILRMNKKYKFYDLPSFFKTDIPILYINLERSTDRKTYMEHELKGLNYTRIEGVDGSKITNKKHDDIGGVNFINNYNSLSKSEIGCTLSHIKSIKYAYEKGLEEVLIIEDDCSFILSPLWKESLEDIIKRLPTDWGIFRLFNISDRCNTFNDTIQKHDNNNPCWSTCIYLINKKGMKDILDIVGYDDIEIGKKNGNNLFPKKGTADIFIYKLTNTYYYTTPLFIAADKILSSTIHENHRSSHISSIDRIIKYYNKNINITDDIFKQFDFAITLHDMDLFLKYHKTPYYLAYGTLLGAYTEGKFISYDGDIDVGVMLKDFNNNILKGDKNFTLTYKRGELNTGLELRFQHNITKVNIDIFVTYIERNEEETFTWTPSFLGKCNEAKNKMCRWKNTNFTMGKISFLNREFNVPYPIEKYLEESYGVNWNIPKNFDYNEGIDNGIYKNLIQEDFPDKNRTVIKQEKKKHDLYPRKINEFKKPIIWMYWENKKGSKRPGYLELCLKSIYKYCGEKFHIIVLNDSLVRDISRTIHPKFTNINPLGMRADYIRFTMVAEYGGIWLDFDTVVTRDISFILEDLKTYNFVGFSHKNKTDISVGVFGGNKNNKVSVKFKNLFENKKKFSKWKKSKTNVEWAEPTILLVKFIKKLIIQNPFSIKTYHAPDIVYPIHWKKSRDYYWSDGKIDYDISKYPLICLHNQTYNHKHKELTPEQVLNDDYRISDLFRRIL
jgi:GR25 family glycosyltransferase involved in LPS biosynthesis